MTGERALAYRRVTQTIAEVGPTKLLAGEQERVRIAADNLIFSVELEHDEAAMEALEDIDRLCASLVGSGRWEAITATRLAQDIAQCGPAVPAELTPA